MQVSLSIASFNLMDGMSLINDTNITLNIETDYLQMSSNMRLRLMML